MSKAVLTALRDLIQVDVGGRGLRADPADNLVTAFPDDFAAACHGIANAAAPVLGIVTGFLIPHATPPCGETDGPLGALYLARALVPLGIKVVLATDDFCVRALEAGIAACGLRKDVPVVCLPSVAESGTQSGDDYRQHFADRAGPLTHLVALERVGPSHTPASVADQGGAQPDTVEAFRSSVPGDHHDRCHTMRGRDITAGMSPAHRLFESAGGAALPFTTIGIGDGGNEIGMGKLPWDVICRNIPNGGMIACRVPADQLIVCGVSNWGGYALAAGVRWLRGVPYDAALFDAAQEFDLLERMIDRGPLVDGTTGQPTATVDGLPFERYVAVLAQIGKILEQAPNP